MNIALNAQKNCGAIKPLHGITNGPISYGGLYNTTKEYVEMGIPLVRLHDTDYPLPQAVDVYQIFRDFDADPDDPASYDFLITDEYIKAIHETGAQVIYRLGTSIEHLPVRRWIAPPKDNMQFARICAGIIRHYNEGFANGFHFGLRYWEIWNEPECGDQPEASNHMWGGTKAQFFALYDVVSGHLKKEFGDRIAVGGYGSSGFYGLELPEAERQDWQKKWIGFFSDFLAFVKEHHCPLEFFTFHYYGIDTERPVLFANYVREKLDAAGFRDCAIILDEWNTWAYDWITEMCGARQVLSMFCALENSPVNAATYYDGQPHMSWCGIFDRLCQKKKPFYAFCIYNKLYRLGTRIDLCADEPLVGMAATNGKTAGVFVVGNETDRTLTLNGICAEKVEALLLDDTHDLTPHPVQKTETGAVCALPAGAVVYVEFENAAAADHFDPSSGSEACRAPQANAPEQNGEEPFWHD